MELVLTHCRMGTGLFIVWVYGGMDRGAGKASPGDSPFANQPSFQLCCGSALWSGGRGGGVSQCLCCLGYRECLLIWMLFGDGTVFSLFFLSVLINGEPRDSRWILGELLCCKNNHIPCKRQASHKILSDNLHRPDTESCQPSWAESILF